MILKSWLLPVTSSSNSRKPIYLILPTACCLPPTTSSDQTRSGHLSVGALPRFALFFLPPKHAGRRYVSRRRLLSMTDFCSHPADGLCPGTGQSPQHPMRSEEHTSELQSLRH